MGRNNAITNKTFDAVKIMTKGGASIMEIAEYLHLGKSTVSSIRSCETFEEFRQRRAAAAFMARKAFEEKKNAETKEQQKPEIKSITAEQPKQVHVTVQATHYMEQELKKQTELLTLISNKLAFIVEQLS